ncbi:hypothetical protein HanPI659440_Chr11g0410161 [Helianthus annuus]|nr:hypothetical protein HanPI659440_Chr11g0410161 [Helianthus annuus]
MITSVHVQEYATGSSSGAQPEIPENTWMGPSVADIYGRDTRKVLVIDDFIDEDEVDMLKKKFDEDVADEGDKEGYEARLELTPEDHACLNAKREAALMLSGKHGCLKVDFV